MDRFPMPAAMPADLAEVLSDRAGDAPDNVDEFILEAEDEIVDAIRCGDGFRRWTLRDVLECWLDQDYKRLQDVAAKLQALTTGSRDARVMAQQEAADWLDGMILATVPRNLVEERSEELASMEYEPEDC